MAAKKKKKARAPKKASRKASKGKKTAAAKAKKSTKKTARKAKKSSKKSVKAPARKAVRKAPAKRAAPKKKATRAGTKGEGDYAASRRFLKDEAGFVEKNKANIPAMGKAAEKALDGPEGNELREAEATAAARSRDTF
jgi:hypothetical protein